jgi:integrase
VKLPRIKIKVNEMRHLTPAGVEAIPGRARDEYGALVCIRAYCAIRAEEAVALRRQNVNVLRSERRIVESATEINGQIRSGATRNRRSRNVTAPGFLMRLIDEHLEPFVPEGPEAPMFGSPHCEPLGLLNSCHRAWYPALEGTDFEGIRVHDLRHTGASILTNQGLHPNVVQQHLGHSSIVVTMDHYGHLYRSDKERVLDVLEATSETG